MILLGFWLFLLYGSPPIRLICDEFDVVGSTIKTGPLVVNFDVNGGSCLTRDDKGRIFLIFFLLDWLNLLIVHLSNQLVILHCRVFHVHVRILLLETWLLLLLLIHFGSGLLVVLVVHAWNALLVSVNLGLWRWLGYLSVTFDLWVHNSDLLGVVTLTLWLLTIGVGCCIGSPHKVVLSVLEGRLTIMNHMRMRFLLITQVSETSVLIW